MKRLGLVSAFCLAQYLCAITSHAVLFEFNGHSYGLTTGIGSWAAAEAEATALGGHLVTINDLAENQFLIDTFLTAPQSSARPYWIGITDQAVEGQFEWISGEPVTYTNWNVATGEPNDYPPEGGEDYGAINWHYANGDTSTRGTWNDTPLLGNALFNDGSDGPYQGIFEFAVPEPGVLGLLVMAGITVSWLRRIGR